MKIAEMMTGMVILSMTAVGMGIFLSDVGPRYGQTDTFDYRVFNQTGELSEKAEELDAQLSTQAGWNPIMVFDVLNFLFFTLSSTLLLIPDIITAAIEGSGLALGFLAPEWLIYGIGTIVAIVIILKVASIVFRREV